MDLGQNKKNPPNNFLDITKIKVHSRFCGELTTWWPGKFLRPSKMDHFSNYGISYTFRDVSRKYPSRYRS